MSYRYVEDSEDAKRNIRTYVGTGGSIGYSAVLKVLFSNESTEEPVTLKEAKDSCYVDGNDFDGRLTALISAARRLCEAYVNLSMIERTVTATVTAGTQLPYGPVNDDAIVSITYEDETEVTDAYKDLANGNYIVTYPVVPDATLAETFKLAILQKVRELFDGKVEGLKAEQILKPFKVL